MDSSGTLGWLGLLFLLLGGGGSKPSPARGGGGSKPASLPSGATNTSNPSVPAPWPQVTPTGLPSFPGSGWEYDEPPPTVVQQRAGQLVAQLWKAGAGTFKIEQTAGRWIAYRAEKVRSGKQGVVAYRLKQAKPAQLPQGGAMSSRPPAAAPRATSSPAPARAPAVTSRSPGIPQAAARPIAVDVGPAQVSPIQLPTLKQGAGMKPAAPLPDVALLQQKLAIAADGRFGPNTTAAVKNFQRLHGLVADGIVGPKTWTALFAVRT